MIVATSEPGPYQQAVESVLEPAYEGAEQAYAVGDSFKGDRILYLLEQALSMALANHAIAAARMGASKEY